MKTQCVDLSQFEAELLLAFMRQPKDMPVPAGLCRMIYRRLEGRPAFARSRVVVYREQTATIRPAAVSK
ncbi:hypothetical protein [uncultured Megasphaera sp.]|uniref:hypothetical protein n=1 Tax=uncultured Megasphaera sp. TaxID=165188 RepID=UPI00265B3965|nr:hypothetical protein [uncultured Megasphaera sp.]